MDPQIIEALRSIASDLAFLGFVGSCAVVGVIVMAEMGVWMGVVKRRGDDEDE